MCKHFKGFAAVEDTKGSHQNRKSCSLILALYNSNPSKIYKILLLQCDKMQVQVMALLFLNFSFLTWDYVTAHKKVFKYLTFTRSKPNDHCCWFCFQLVKSLAKPYLKDKIKEFSRHFGRVVLQNKMLWLKCPRHAHSQQQQRQQAMSFYGGKKVLQSRECEAKWWITVFLFSSGIK